MARVVWRRGTHRGTQFLGVSTRFFKTFRARFGILGAFGILLSILSRGDPLPAVALVAARRVAAVDGRDHLDVGMAELAGDQLVGRPRPDRTDGVEVLSVVQTMMRQAKCD